MRAAPAAQFTLPRCGDWKTAAMVLVVIASSTLALWLARRPDGSVGVASAVMVGMIFAGLSLLWLRGLQPASLLRLHWDSQRWLLGPAELTGHDPVAGELTVAIDLGAWMLLRFRPEAVSPRRAATDTWLPVQRRDRETQWHSLRCAVYSPRPIVAVGANTDV